MKIVMLGAPGAGKGTQAKRLAARYGIPHISTGDIFRAYISKKTEIGIMAKGLIDQGLLVPDEIVMKLVADRFMEADCVNGYVLDGFPRTMPQVVGLDESLAKDNDKISFAINVHVPDEHIIQRMAGRRSCPKCGASYHLVSIPSKEEGICDFCGKELVLREDDKPETVRKRLEIYHEQTKPLIDYYQSKGVLKSVDGTKDMEEVFQEIIHSVEA